MILDRESLVLIDLKNYGKHIWIYIWLVSRSQVIATRSDSFSRPVRDTWCIWNVPHIWDPRPVEGAFSTNYASSGI